MERDKPDVRRWVFAATVLAAAGVLGDLVGIATFRAMPADNVGAGIAFTAQALLLALCAFGAPMWRGSATADRRWAWIAMVLVLALGVRIMTWPPRLVIEYIGLLVMGACLVALVAAARHLRRAASILLEPTWTWLAALLALILLALQVPLSLIGLLDYNAIPAELIFAFGIVPCAALTAVFWRWRSRA